MANAVRIWLIIGRVLLALVLCAAVVVTLLAFSLRGMFRRETYVTATGSDAFLTKLHTAALENLETECRLYELPYDVVAPAVSRDLIHQAARTRMAGLYDYLTNGTALPKATVDAAPLKAAIERYFATLPVEEQPNDPTETAATIASELAQNISYVVGIGIGDSLLFAVRPAFAVKSVFRQLANAAWWCLLIVVVLAAVSMLPHGSTWRKRAYSTAGTLFIGSSLVAVPMWWFLRQNLPAKIAVGESALRDYMRETMTLLLQRINCLTTIVFIATAVLLVASVVWMVFERKPKTDTPQ